MATINDAINLIPNTIRDDRGKYFAQILWWMCASQAELDAATIPPSLIAYKLNQFGLGAIAGTATRLPIATQRQLLAEASEIVRLSGTPWSIKRTLELFEYAGVTFNENPTIDSVKRWGEFEVITQQPVRYAEVEAIINLLKPPSRKLIAIRNINAILFNGSQILNGSSVLGGFPGDETPSSWLDAATALAPIPGATIVPDLTTADTNAAVNFNNQLQAIINRIRLEDNALTAVTTRVVALNTSINALNGGTIAPQLTAINSNLTTLTNSNAAMLTRLNQLTPLVNSLTGKTNTLETQTTTITTASNARQLDATVQRKDPDLEAIAALSSTAPYPANKVIASTPGNNIAWQDTPALGAFIPQVCNLEFKQPAGTNAGNYPTANTWAAMPFTIANNDDGFVSAVSASRFTLPAGTYLISYQFQGCGCLGFGGRIWNQTAGSAIEQGSPGLTATGGGNVGDTWSAEGMLLAGFALTAVTNIEFQFIAKTLHPSGAALTAGQSTANAIEQIYQEVVIMRISN